MKTYRIVRNTQTNKKLYFGGHIIDNNNHWVVDIREAYMYFAKEDAKEDIKKYNIKNVEILEEL